MDIITNKLKARFCKDSNLPITIYDEPYFTDRIELYDNQFNSRDKWARFINEVRKYADEQEYLSEYNKVKDKAINAVKSTTAWEQFNAEDMNKYGTADLKFPSNSIYKDSNNGRTFLSVDMKHANFSALKHYNEEMFKVGDKICDTWEEFISQFTDNEHIIQSKYIRQVVLGNCNPKRTITYEKGIIGRFIRTLAMADMTRSIVSFAADEVIFDLTEFCEKQRENRINLVTGLIDVMNVPLKVETFTLHKIKGTDGFVKKYITGKEGIDIKCINSLYMPFVLRKLNNEDVTESDKTFVHEGMTARIIKAPEIEIPEE